VGIYSLDTSAVVKRYVSETGSVSVYVVRAFIQMREQLAANSEILRRLAEIDKTLLQHNAGLRDIYQKLRPLLQPATDPPRRRIGFGQQDK
jgi:predicted nucleic acid-binding protein